MLLNPLETLQQLVAIPSVNPMGRVVSGPEYLEGRMTDHLQQLFTRLGLPWKRQTVEPGRDNIVARLDGPLPPAEGGRLILLEAHQDTVPVDGMTIPPWTPEIRDGRIYGRGSCDIKGGMAAMLAALARLAQERPAQMPTIVMACTVNEEHGYSGAQALTTCWTDGPDPIIGSKPDVAIVAEPTELNVVVAHKGAVRWKCHTRGRAAHSSQPQLGENALYAMARVLTALEEYNRDVLSTGDVHPLCGGATLSVGMIEGGLSVNTVPDQCVIEIDRRMLPGEDNREVYADVVRFVAERAQGGASVEHEEPYMDGATLADTHNGSLAEALVAVAQQVALKSEKVGVPYGTDASRIAAANVPTVVFGPGSIAQAHTADEWLDLRQLDLATEILYRFCAGGAR